MGLLMDISPPLIPDIEKDSTSEEKMQFILELLDFKFEEMERSIEDFKQRPAQLGSSGQRIRLENVSVAARNIAQLVSIYAWEQRHTAWSRDLD